MTTTQNEIQTREQTLQALWTLSGLPEGLDTTWLSNFVSDAPDPETAHRIIESHIRTDSNTLRSKWRKIINEMWFEHHSHIHAHFSIPITSKDVTETHILLDANALLDALLHEPARITRNGKYTKMHQKEVTRLINILPSVQKQQSFIPNNEHDHKTLHHVCEILQVARLIRVYKGKLVIVKSRYERFRQLPLPQQFYILWHSNMYHVHWANSMGQWEPYIRTVQQYLPLIWKMMPDIQQGTVGNAHDFVHTVVEGCYPLWQQEGLFSRSVHRIIFADMYKQSILYPIIETLLIDNILTQYGLIDVSRKVHERCGAISCDMVSTVEDGTFEWTHIGAVLVQAEREQNIPCAAELLN